jgi:C_GCAxxG_C_C family probable redox protein
MAHQKHRGPTRTNPTSPQTDRRRILTAVCSLSPALVLGGRFPAQPSGRSTPAGVPRTTEDRIDLALMRFQMGFHCSQSVMEAYADDFGLDPVLARRIAAALAGGSTVGGECGAIGSGYLVLGLRHSHTWPAYGDVDKEKDLFGRVTRFVDEFKKRHGAITCRELLGVDVFTKEGRDEGLRKNLFATRCPQHIRDAITILDSLG